MPDDVLEMIGTAALLEQLAEESAGRWPQSIGDGTNGYTTKSSGR